MSWKTAKLGDICQIGDGAHASLKRVKEGIPYLTAKNVTKHGIDYTSLDYISEATYQKYFKDNTSALTKPKKDDILYSIIGSNIGGVCLVGDEKIGISSSVAIFRCCEKFYPQYVYYYFKSEYFDLQIQSIKGGSAQNFMSLKKLGDVMISYPDYEAQRRIASILSAYDDLIENNQKQIKLLEEAAQRLYKEWFVDLRFPGWENAKIVDGVPEGWKKERLADIAEVLMGQSPKSEYYNNKKQGLPFHQGVGSYGTRFVIDDTYSTSFTRIAEAGSILFSVRAPVGRLNITKNKIVIGRGLSSINHKKGLQSYLFYLLKERFFKDDLVGNGSIFASISKDELLSQIFLIPNKNIDKKYNDIVIDIDRKIESIDNEVKLLIEAQYRLLPKLMSGELEV